MDIIVWEKWNCGDYMGPEKMYRVCGQSKRNLEELYEKLNIIPNHSTINLIVLSILVSPVVNCRIYTPGLSGAENFNMPCCMLSQ